MPTSRFKNFVYRIALPFFVPSVPAGPAVFQEGHPLSEAESLFKSVRRNHITGGAFWIQSKTGNTSVFTKAVHTDLVPDKHTYFRVASITKMATAFLTVRLMDQGLLDPQMPVAEILPDGKTAPELRDVLICHLLSHTSGLMDPKNYEQLLYDQLPYVKAISGCRVSEPGVSFRYSNLGYGLIGCIFEALLNKPLGKIFDEYLFQPLEMNATLEGCSLSDKQIMPIVRIRMLFNKAENGLRVTRLGRIPLEKPDPLIHYGHTAGSMYTDLPSLAKMTCVIRDGGTPLLSPQYAGYMKKETASYGSVSPTLSYGSGLLLIRDSRISSGVVYGHQGFAYGCVDGAFWEETTGNVMISLNGGCSEARMGRLGTANFELCRWAFRKELPLWK